jgi:hypothetical protein
VSLLDVLRTGVKIADQVTKPVQATVTYHKATIGSDGYRTITHQTGVSLRAIVDWKQKQVRTLSGMLSVTRAIVTFLDVAELASATSNDGIGDHDKIVLPDGTTGPILDLGGFIDAGTGQPLATEVMLG